MARVDISIHTDHSLGAVRRPGIHVYLVSRAFGKNAFSRSVDRVPPSLNFNITGGMLSSVRGNLLPSRRRSLSARLRGGASLSISDDRVRMFLGDLNAIYWVCKSRLPPLPIYIQSHHPAIEHQSQMEIMRQERGEDGRDTVPMCP